MKPSITVVIPTYNRAHFLGFALDSVHAQTRMPAEIIVVDNGSTDETSRVVRGFPGVQYIYQANAGPAAARNVGIARASGDYLAFLDSDDTWRDSSLEALAAHLDHHPACLVVVGHSQNYLEDGGTVELTANGISVGRSVNVNFPSCMFRKEAFAIVGMLEGVTDDLDWFLRAAERNIQPDIIDHIVLNRRLHADNLTLAKLKLRQSTMTAIKASLDRRRKLGNPAGGSLLPWVRLVQPLEEGNGE